MMKRKLPNSLIFSALLLGLAAVLVGIPASRDFILSIGRSSPDSASTSPPSSPGPRTESTGTGASLPVEAVVVQRQPFLLRVQGSGRVESIRRAELAARVSQQVEGIHVSEFHKVRQGDLLLELNRRPFEIAVEEARARLTNARIDHDVQILGEEDISPEKSELVAHRSGLTVALQQLARAELDLEATQLMAPFDGYIVEIHTTLGESVASGQILITMVDLDHLRVPVEVLESQFGNLRPGAAVSLTLAALPGQEFYGRLMALSPELDPERGTGIAFVEIANRDERIRPGMLAQARITAGSLEDRLAIPRSALLERDRRLLVFLARSGRAEWSYVDTGRESEQQIEITSGIAPGDTVLVGGHLTLAHGAPIRLELIGDGN